MSASPRAGTRSSNSDSGPSDKLVAAAVGMTSYNGVNYQTVAETITGLLPPGSAGINHGEWREHTRHHLSMRRYYSPACVRDRNRRCRDTPYCHNWIVTLSYYVIVLTLFTKTCLRKSSMISSGLRVCVLPPVSFCMFTTCNRSITGLYTHL